MDNFIQSIIPLKKVKKIQYSILSDEEKKKISVVSQTEMAGFEAGVYIKGSPYDLSTGTITDNERCGTCKLSQKEDPGHFGHIELAQKVCNPLYINDIEKILNSICFRCANTLVPIQYHEPIKRLSKIKRLPVCKSYSKDKFCNICNLEKKNPIFTVKNNIYITFKESKNEKAKFLPCEYIKNLFSLIKDEIINLMGFDPRFSRPENLIMGVQLVPPPTIRPTVERSAGKKSEDNLYKLISEIIKKNEKLKKSLKKESKNITQPSLEYENLCLWITYLMSNKLSNKNQGVSYASGGAPIKSIRELITGKEGIIRENIMGKRVNYSARTVISPDVNLNVDEIGIPKKIAMILTFPEIVNSDNIERIKKLIRNGSNTYPGANVIESVKTGKRKILTSMSEDMIENIIKNISYGDKIKRHLIDGDVAMFNRQPTLHKYGIMGYKIKVLENNHTIRLGLPATEAHNADFDGDESNLHIPINMETKAEVMELMMVRKHIVNMSNSSVLVTLIQDNVLGLYLITKFGHSKINRDIFMLLVSSSRYFNIDKIPKGQKEFELIECINNILPNDLHIPSLNIIDGRFFPLSEKDDDDDEEVISSDTYEKLKFLTERMLANEHLVKDNTIENLSDKIFKSDRGDKSKYAILTKSNIPHQLIKKVFIEYGPNVANNIIVALQKLTNKFLMLYGATCSIKDVIVPDYLKKIFNENIEKSHKAIYKLLNDFSEGNIKTPVIKKVYDNYEDKIGEVTSKYTKENAMLMEEYIKKNKDSNFANMIYSRSKGKITNVLQINVEIGSQTIMGKRIGRTFGTSRTLPHFTKFSEDPRSAGMIPTTFSDGMSAIDFFCQSAAGRAGLMDTSLGVRKTGYLERRLVKSLEDINCTYDGLVRRVDGRVIDYSYGGTNYDPIYLEDNKLNIKMKDNNKLIEEYL